MKSPRVVSGAFFMLRFSIILLLIWDALLASTPKSTQLGNSFIPLGLLIFIYLIFHIYSCGDAGIDPGCAAIYPLLYNIIYVNLFFNKYFYFFLLTKLSFVSKGHRLEQPRRRRGPRELPRYKKTRAVRTARVFIIRREKEIYLSFSSSSSSAYTSPR